MMLDVLGIQLALTNNMIPGFGLMGYGREGSERVQSSDMISERLTVPGGGLL